MARGRRILIDGTMAKGGGGFTYLVNILPRLVEIAPEDRFRVLVRSERLARSIEAGPNLEIDLLPEVSPLQRLRFTYRDLPRLLKSWGADLDFSAGESTPLLNRIVTTSRRFSSGLWRMPPGAIQAAYCADTHRSKCVVKCVVKLVPS